MNNLFFKNSSVLLTAAVLVVIGFFICSGTALAADPVYGVTQVTAVKTFASADGTFENGWSWIFEVTVPENEQILQMKFTDWTGALGVVPAAGNLQFYSPQSVNAFDAASAIVITGANDYSAEMILTGDIDLLRAGRQIRITVEARIPVGSAGGSYSTQFGIRTTPDSVAPVITLIGDNPQTIERGTAYSELGATALDNIDGVVVVTTDASAVNVDVIGAYAVNYSAVDSSGNTASVARTVDVNDTIAPTATVSYSTTEPTNQDVVATITPDEDIIGDLTHTFTDNGVFIFKFTDLAGNAGSVEATVSNIDKIAPTLTVTGFTANRDVMSGNLEAGYILNTNNIASHEYLVQFADGTFPSETLATEYFGLFLKSSTVSANDLKAYYNERGVPEPFLTYLSAAVDGDNPFVYINGSAIKLTDAAKHDLFGGNVDMTIPGNYPLGTYVVEGNIKDLVGNTTTITYVLIVSGDRIAPTATVSYSTTEPTNQDVVATITPSETIIGDLTHTFTDNGVFIFEFTDLAGNAGSVEATVSNIDIVAPVITIAPYETNPTNQSITVSASTNEGTLNFYSHFFEENDSFDFVATDDAGNITTETVEITNIDKVAPVITILGEGNDGNPAYVLVDSNYEDAGATAADNADGDITSLIESLSTVDTSDIDVYTVTYNVTDAAGNPAVPAVRTVNVIAITQTITVSQSTGGSISAIAQSFTNPKYEFTANAGYYIADVKVDGETVIGQVVFKWIEGNTVADYTFTNVVGSHTLSAVFELIPTLQSIAITTPATKRSYFVDEILDISGLVVTGTYNNGSPQVETITTDNITHFDSSVPVLDKDLTITVEGQNTTYKVDIFAVADINKDGKVDGADLLAFENNSITSGCALENLYCNGADINRNGNVDAMDYLALKRSFGSI